MKIALRASVAALLIAAASGATITAAAHAPSDPLHGGTGVGVRVLGHTDLGGGGLNGHVDVLDNIAFVGQGTNGGFAAQWNKTPTCKVAGGPTSTIKVVDLSNRANPTVVSTISVGDRWTLARDVDALKVKAITAGNVYTPTSPSGAPASTSTTSPTRRRRSASAPPCAPTGRPASSAPRPAR
jgi:hypothetical protein